MTVGPLGGVALLEEAHYWGFALRVHNFISPLPLFPCVDESNQPLLAAATIVSLSHGSQPSGTISQNKLSPVSHFNGSIQVPWNPEEHKFQIPNIDMKGFIFTSEDL